MTIITEFIAETATACAIIACGADESEKPPPIMQTMDEILDDYGLAMPAEHAPYIDEETAEFYEQINALRSEVIRLESENKRLKESNKSRNSSAVSNYKPSPKAAEESSPSVSMNAESTFYTAHCSTGCTGVTATGYDVSNTIYSPEGYRIIAADPNVYPLKSIVDVTLANGDSFRAKVLDTGGDIKGGRIDVLVATKDEARRLGRQKASVKIVE